MISKRVLQSQLKIDDIIYAIQEFEAGGTLKLFAGKVAKIEKSACGAGRDLGLAHLLVDFNPFLVLDALAGGVEIKQNQKYDLLAPEITVFRDFESYKQEGSSRAKARIETQAKMLADDIVPNSAKQFIDDRMATVSEYLSQVAKAYNPAK